MQLIELEGPCPVKRGEFYIRFFPAGDNGSGGDMILVKSHIGNKPHMMLVDGGWAETYRKFENQLPKSFDDVVASHFDNDHINGLIPLVKERPVQRLWVPFKIPKQTIIEGRDRLLQANLGEKRQLLVASIGQGENLLNAAEGRAEVCEIRSGRQIGPFSLLSPSNEFARELKEVLLKRHSSVSAYASGGERVMERHNLNYLCEASASEMNEISSIMWSDFAGKLPGGILLTADACRSSFSEAYKFARQPISLSKLAVLQMPHHGSINNHWDSFLSIIRADNAVISAPVGSTDHPHPDILDALSNANINTHRTQGRSVLITNTTPTIGYWEMVNEIGRTGVTVYRSRA